LCSGQVEQFDPIGILLHPGGHHLGAVDAQVVDDEEDLAGRVFDQAAQEAQEDAEVVPDGWTVWRLG